MEHLKEAVLAALAEGRPASRATLRHLSGCPECFRAYMGAVEKRKASVRDPIPEGEATGSSTLVDSAEPGPAAAPGSPSPAAPGSPSPAAPGPLPPGSRRSFRRLLFLPVATGIVFAALGVWTLSGRHGDPDLYHAAFSPLVQTAVREVSATGLVLVGGEAAADRISEPRRGTTREVDSGVLLDLAGRYRETRSVELGLEVVAGYLAAQNHENAGSMVREIAMDHPDDPRLRMLEAVVAWRSNRLEEAERLLARLLGDHPGYQTARLNHAIVLHALGDAERARGLLREVVRSSGDTPLGRRAARELKTRFTTDR